MENIPEPRAFNDAALELIGVECKLVASCLPRMVEADAAHYVRHRDLPYVLALFPNELQDYSVRGTRYIISKLFSLANAYRNTGMVKHWSYDLSKHVAVLACLTGEQARLTELEAN